MITCCSTSRVVSEESGEEWIEESKQVVKQIREDELYEGNRRYLVGGVFERMNLLDGRYV